MVGYDQNKIVQCSSKAEAESLMGNTLVPPEVFRWEARYSSFGDCWVIAALSEKGFLLGYLLKA